MKFEEAVKLLNFPGNIASFLTEESRGIPDPKKLVEALSILMQKINLHMTEQKRFMENTQLAINITKTATELRNNGDEFLNKYPGRGLTRSEAYEACKKFYNAGYSRAMVEFVKITCMEKDGDRLIQEAAAYDAVQEKIEWLQGFVQVGNGNVIEVKV